MRVRVLDLPFTAVEWVLPSEMTHASAEALSPAKWMVWERSPLAKERSLQVGSCWAMSGTCQAEGRAASPAPRSAPCNDHLLVANLACFCQARVGVCQAARSGDSD